MTKKYPLPLETTKLTQEIGQKMEADAKFSTRNQLKLSTCLGELPHYNSLRRSKRADFRSSRAHQSRHNNLLPSPSCRQLCKAPSRRGKHKILTFSRAPFERTTKTVDRDEGQCACAVGHGDALWEGPC